ncbi:MAG: aminotransferase class V-fold PLP-dependent enzyme [Azospirillaceae bacterium]
MSRIVYLDHNATAPLRADARAALIEALDLVGNPSSVHAAGRAARRAVESAREAVAALVGAAPAEVVFTSGATEANATVLAGAGRPVLAAGTEHDSVRAGLDGAPVPVDAEGRIDLSFLDRRLAEAGAPALVSVMLANNETGVVQPVAEAAAIARRHGALVHCDAVQAAGRLAVDRDALDVDYLTLSAHKIGGPRGVGAVVARDGVPLAPLVRGGGQERRRRAGTENVAAIAGFGAAARAAAAEAGRLGALEALRDGLVAGIRAADPTAPLWGEGAGRLPNTACIGMPGVPAETQVMGFDLAGIAVSAGSACSSGKVAASHVLDAMGAGAAAGEAVRFSLGPETTADEIERAVAAWAEVAARARGRRAGPGAAA